MARAHISRVAGRRSSERGFALFEVLIAFVILALGLGALSAGIAVAMRSDSRAQFSRTVYRLAQSRLETAGVSEKLTPGRRNGTAGDHASWQQTTTPLHLGTLSQATGAGTSQATAPSGMQAFWVEVEVKAIDGTGAKVAVLKLAQEGRR